MQGGELFLLLMKIFHQRRYGGCTFAAHMPECTVFLHHSGLRRASGSRNMGVAPSEPLPLKTPPIPVCSALW